MSLATVLGLVPRGEGAGLNRVIFTSPMDGGHNGRGQSRGRRPAVGLRFRPKNGEPLARGENVFRDSRSVLLDAARRLERLV